MAGLLLFAISSLLCGLSVSSGMLIAMRLVQGAAGAILSPSVFSITLVTFREGPSGTRPSGLSARSPARAPPSASLGGILTEYAGWEWIFFANVPIGLVALALVPRYVRESR